MVLKRIKGNLFQAMNTVFRAAAKIYQKINHPFRALKLKHKLSIIIALIVVVVIIAFSFPVLLQQKNILHSKVAEMCRINAELLSGNVKDILLCRITGGCDASGSEQEQLERLIATNIKYLDFAYVVDINKNVTIKPNSMQQYFKTTPGELERLLSYDQPVAIESGETLIYNHPVKVRLDDAGRTKLLGVVGVGFSRKAISDPLKSATTLVLSAALLIIIISGLGIYWLAEKLVQRITALSEAARQVGKGDLTAKVDVLSNDELGQLGRDFNLMINHLHEKLQMQKFVSKLTVQMISKHSGSRMQPTEGQRHHVAILFSDIRNFTSIAERLEPEEIVRLINRYFQIQTEAIEENGGIVDKFMGDQIMAIFPAENRLTDAITAAVAIQRKIRSLNEVRCRNGGVVLDVGIGINYGRAVLGNMGSKERMDYTVIGDVVNIASRLCSIAKARQIIASMDAVKGVNGKYATTRLQSIIVKGRSRSIEICEINYEYDYIV